MAKPIPATPTVHGADADKIRHEMTHGTPNTPQRIETIRRADEVYARHAASTFDACTLPDSVLEQCVAEAAKRASEKIGWTWALKMEGPDNDDPYMEAQAAEGNIVGGWSTMMLVEWRQQNESVGTLSVELLAALHGLSLLSTATREGT